MTPQDFNTNKYYLYFMIAVTEEFIFRSVLLYLTVFVAHLFNFDIYLALKSYIIASSMMYAIAHKLLFSWKMVVVTFFIGLIFGSIWAIAYAHNQLFVIIANIVTVVLHFCIIVLNDSIHVS